MAFLYKEGNNPVDRPCPRWGEQDDIKHGRNYRVVDGFSRFRTNFDATHELPIESEVKHLEGYAYPKPFEVDISGRVTVLPPPTRKVDRGESVDVFPQHDPDRLNDQGDHCLSDNTRQSIQAMTNKLYANSRYQNIFPGSYMCSTDKTQLFDINQQKCPKHVSFSEFVRNRQQNGDKREVANFESRLRKTSDSEDDININQNFNFLMSSVYHYMLPSALHMPDDNWQKDILPYLNTEPLTKEPEIRKLQTFQRPTAPSNIGSFMDSVKTEMDISEYDKLNQPTVSNCMVKDIPDPCVGEWENSSDLYKLKLDDKTGTQKSYQQTHGEPLPDLRDNKKYSKRVMFYGFYSSAFRG